MSFNHSLGIGACLLIMVAIVALGPYHVAGSLAADQGMHWYYWKRTDPTFWTRFWPWTLYALHQLGLWALIAYAQRQRPAYRAALHPINIAALAWNGLFVALHILQTRLTYDGLAQDTSVMSSQFSVIFMLVFILIMEHKRRGILFGQRFGFMDTPGAFLRRYHGYYFSWAIVYTFWFHPIEDNLGHLLGTFYTLLLLLQGSLFFTRFHTDRVWTLLLETFVLIHGAMVAYLTLPGGHWKMFAFGFMTLFVVTQMHGLGLTARLRWLLIAVYLVLVGYAYWGSAGELGEVLRIPAAELGLAAAISGLCWLGLRLYQRRAGV